MLPEKKKTSKKRKALYLFGVFIAVFGFFIYLLMIPSLKSEAVRELAVCNNVDEVKQLYQKYKLELSDNDDFLNEVRTRLTSFNLTDSVLMDCQSWLPQPPLSLNVVIIPDLSKRIIDEKNNEHQVSNDKAIMKHIWETFESQTMLKKNSKDRLKVTISDPGQARGQFDQLADELVCDLSIHKDKVNRMFFTDYKKRKFLKNIDELYTMSLDKTSGADYVSFLKRYLERSIKTATLFNRYKNKLIIITDGYLESEEKIHTKMGVISKPQADELLVDEIIQHITQKKYGIPIAHVDLSETEVLICEVNERKKGLNYHFQILHAYWEDWFSRMNAKDFQFIRRDYSMKETFRSVDKFLYQ